MRGASATKQAESFLCRSIGGFAALAMTASRARGIRMSARPHHPASFRGVAVLGKVRIVFGLKNIAWTSVRSRESAAAGPDAHDRRLSAHAGDADRGRHLLRTQCILRELERRFPAPTLFRRNRVSPGPRRCGPTGRSSKTPSTSCSARSPTRSRRISSKIGKSCAAPNSMSRR